MRRRFIAETLTPRLIRKPRRSVNTAIANRKRQGNQIRAVSHWGCPSSHDPDGKVRARILTRDARDYLSGFGLNCLEMISQSAGAVQNILLFLIAMAARGAAGSRYINCDDCLSVAKRSKSERKERQKWRKIQRTKERSSFGRVILAAQSP